MGWVQLFSIAASIGMIALIPQIDREQRKITRRKGEAAAWMFTLAWCFFCIAVTAAIVSANLQT